MDGPTGKCLKPGFKGVWGKGKTYLIYIWISLVVTYNVSFIFRDCAEMELNITVISVVNRKNDHIYSKPSCLLLCNKLERQALRPSFTDRA